MKTENVMPSGSEVPEESGQTESTEENNEQKSGGQGTTSPEDNETAKLKSELADLQKVLGRQGKELGDLRKQSQESAPAEEAKDYDALEANITDRLDAGDLDLKTALREMNKLATERGALVATDMMRQEQEENNNAEAVSNFRSNNPDFDIVVENGSLDAIIASNPLHDNFSAYHEYKRNEVTAAMEAKVAEARQAGEQDGRKIASESQNASRVLGKKNDSTRFEQTQTTTRAGTNKAMLEALRSARA